jgi:hypothetical protein
MLNPRARPARKLSAAATVRARIDAARYLPFVHNAAVFYTPSKDADNPVIRGRCEILFAFAASP